LIREPAKKEELYFFAASLSEVKSGELVPYFDFFIKKYKYFIIFVILIFLHKIFQYRVNNVR